MADVDVKVGIGIGQHQDFVIFEDRYTGDERIGFRKMKGNELVFIDLGPADTHRIDFILECLGRLRIHCKPAGGSDTK